MNHHSLPFQVGRYLSIVLNTSLRRPKLHLTTPRRPNIFCKRLGVLRLAVVELPGHLMTNASKLAPDHHTHQF